MIQLLHFLAQAKEVEEPAEGPWGVLFVAGIFLFIWSLFSSKKK